MNAIKVPNYSRNMLNYENDNKCRNFTTIWTWIFFDCRADTGFRFRALTWLGKLMMCPQVSNELQNNVLRNR